MKKNTKKLKFIFINPNNKEIFEKKIHSIILEKLNENSFRKKDG